MGDDGLVLPTCQHVMQDSRFDARSATNLTTPCGPPVECTVARVRKANASAAASIMRILTFGVLGSIVRAHFERLRAGAQRQLLLENFLQARAHREYQDPSTPTPMSVSPSRPPVLRCGRC